MAVAEDAKVCLVTGSSRGLGKAIALELGKAGQKVVINYVSEASHGSADQTVEEIKALGGDAFAIQCDSTFYWATKGGTDCTDHLVLTRRVCGRPLSVFFFLVPFF